MKKLIKWSRNLLGIVRKKQVSAFFFAKMSHETRLTSDTKKGAGLTGVGVIIVPLRQAALFVFPLFFSLDYVKNEVIAAILILVVFSFTFYQEYYYKRTQKQ